MNLFGWGSNKNTHKKTTHLPANLQDDALKFKVIIDSIEEGVILVDDQSIVQVMNPGAGVICGWGPDEATGLDIASVIQLVNEKGEAMSPSGNPFKQVFEDGQVQRNDNAFLL